MSPQVWGPWVYYTGTGALCSVSWVCWLGFRVSAFSVLGFWLLGFRVSGFKGSVPVVDFFVYLFL